MGGGKSSTRLKKGVKSPIFGATSSSNTPPTSSSSSSSAGSNNGTASAEKSGNNSPSNNNSSSSYNYHHNNSNINNIISRIQIHDNIAKLISFRSPTTTYMFVNFGRVLLWLDYDLKPNDPLSLITFKDSVIITCHDANLMLKDTMDLVVGFNSGDIMLYSPVSCKWQRFNRQVRGEGGGWWGETWVLTFSMFLKTGNDQ